MSETEIKPIKTVKETDIKPKNRNYRKLCISNFRNIGIGEEKAELVLNRSLKKEELGGLVFLVGPNNSGKSNVLEAMLAFETDEIYDEDVPDFSYESLEPELEFIVSNGEKRHSPLSNGKIESYQKPEDIKIDTTVWDTLNNSSLLYLIKSIANMDAFEKVLETFEGQEFSPGKEGFIEYVSYLEQILIYAYFNNSLNTEQISLLRLFVGTGQEYEKIYGNSGVALTAYVLNNRADQRLGFPRQELEGKFGYTIIENPETKAMLERQEADSVAFRKIMGYDMSPSFVTYEQETISQTDLTCDPEYPNQFIKTVLKLLGKKEDTLSNVYSKYKPKKQMNILSSFEKELNKDVCKNITDRFNSLYFCGEGEKYEFKMKATSTEFGMELYRGNVPLDLDKQSMGFRWFFDFFFNFMCKNDLKFGDIVLMDEPATNLHVSGQIELRKYLKEFSRNNGLTFVISTHSPFFLDCDHLDEVRIMTRDPETGYVKINNRFTVIGNECLDTLDPVLNGMTVGRHILIDPKQKVIFTEGITDYSYLVAFKHLFAPKYDTLTFLPINGIKRDDLFKALLRIDRSPILLVDGDGIGKEIKTRSKGTGVTVISLEDLGNPALKEIENMFTVEDRKQFNLYEKSWDEATVFKNSISENAGKLKDATKERFEKLLDYLLVV